MKKQIPLAALMGVTGVVGLASVADAVPVAATLVSVATFSANGSAAFNRTLDTSTWTFDSAAPAAAAVQTGGTYSALTKAGPSPLFRTTMTGVTLGSGTAAGATWACLEGNFGTGVGASICGNYNFGTNLSNESTYTPTVTSATVGIGGDDGAIGPPQSLASSFSGMTTTALGGAPVGFQNYCLSNANVNCSTTSTSGYNFVFQTQTAVIPAPPAVWLLGTGLVGLIARRIRKQKTA